MKELLKLTIEAATVITIVMVMSGCGMVNGIGDDMKWGSTAGAKFLEEYGENQYESLK
jgi:hypothetical protein